MLHTLGLDEAAQLIYRFVLMRQGCSLVEVADVLGLAEEDAKSRVDLLSDLRLLRRQGDVLYPGSPTVGLQSLLQRQQTDLLRRQQELAETRAAVNGLIAEYEQVCCAGVRNEWERLDGALAVEARTEALARQSRTQCLSMMPPGPQSADGLTSRKAFDEDLLRRGVSVSTVFQDCVHNDRASLRYAEWLARAGGQVATVPTLPTWMIIFDRTTALLPIDSESENYSVFQVTGAGIITALYALFDHIWSSAAPLGGARDTFGDEPNNVERELLRLLGQGFTDEAIRKKLGIGLRTARRMVADLMNKLNARSRFEAGANAVQRGWLEPRHDGSAPRVPEPRRATVTPTDEPPSKDNESGTYANAS